MKKTTWICMIGIVLPALLLLSACNPIENDSKSASFIIVESILGNNATGSSNLLYSDVLKVDETTQTATVVSDTASAVLRASLLDPAPILKPSQYNDIIIDRYIVSYTRVEGKNRQGVDVPYYFEGSLSQILKIGAVTSFSFVVVREIAKTEPPLVNLVAGNEENVIQATAKIEFYGHDLSNRKVTATGYLPIFFGNYAEDN